MINYSNRLIRLFWCVIFSAGLMACSSAPTLLPPTQAAADVIDSNRRYQKIYRLMPGDRLDVLIYQNSELSRSVVIRSDGFISFPLLDDVKAAGLTLPELDEKITKLLSKRLRTPDVTVILTNPIEPNVYVLGDVGGVQPVPFRQAQTIAQALVYSGGLKRESAREEITVIRLSDDGFFQTLSPISEHRSELDSYLGFNNFALQPEDVVVVPESKRSLASRWMRDYITNPLSALNQILTPYFQILLIEEVDD